jgi:hypothetical protein
VSDRRNLGWTILSLVGATVILYIGITILPWINPTSPFRTPFSELSTRNQRIFLSDALSSVNKVKGRTIDIWKLVLGRPSKTTGTDSPLDLGVNGKDRTSDIWFRAKNRTLDIWHFLGAAWKNLQKIPDEPEVRLGICWSILKNSSKNVSIQAAVSELTTTKITTEQRRRLIEYGLPDELSNRLAHLPTSNRALIERMKNYLRVFL